MDNLTDVSAAEPAAHLDPARQALWWLRKGDFKTGTAWDQAHDLCQAQEGEKIFDWIHALVHLIEGDTWNSNYWYRRAGEQRLSDDPAEEWQRVVSALDGA